MTYEDLVKELEIYKKALYLLAFDDIRESCDCALTEIPYERCTECQNCAESKWLFENTPTIIKEYLQKAREEIEKNGT